MDLLKASNLNNFCRLCLRGDGEIPVFAKEAESDTSLSRRILDCVSVEIFEEDKLPTAVCKLCFNNVNSWFDFKETCDKTQKTLQMWLQYQQSSNSENENGSLSSSKECGSLPAANVTSSSEKTSEVTEVNVSSSVECVSNTLPSNDVIEIDSGDEANHSTDKEGNENSLKSLQQVEMPVVKIKIESTQSLSMDAFNNYNDIESAAASDAERNNLEIGEIDKSSNLALVDNEDESRNNSKDAPFQCDEASGSGKRKRDQSLSDAENSRSRQRIDESAPSVNSEENSSNVNIDTEGPKTANSSVTEQSDTISVTDAIADTTSEGSHTSQRLPVHIMKREPVNHDGGEESIAFVHVRVKSEMPLEYMDEEEGGIEEDEGGGEETEEIEGETNNSTNPEEKNEEETLCVVCNRNYTSRGNLIRHMKSKMHIKLSSASKEGDLGSANDDFVTENDDFMTADDDFMTVNDDLRTIHPRKCKSIGCYDSDVETQKSDYPYEHENLRVTPSGSARRKDEVTYDCRACNASFRSRSERERHYLSMKHQTMMAKQKSLTDNSYSLETHTPVGRGTLEDDKIFACPVDTCDLTFSSGLLLISHMKRHGIISNMSRELISSNFVNPPPPSPPPVIKKQYSCNRCGVKFNTPVGKSNHLRYCKGRGVKRRQNKELASSFDGRDKTDELFNSKYCSLCNLPFPDNITFMNHFEMYHNGSFIHQTLTSDKPNQSVGPKILASKISRAGIYKCKLCPKSFNFIRSLQYHMKKHKLDGQSHVCKVCKKVFRHIRNFRIHLRKHFLPDGSKQLLCTTCYQAFDTRSDISRHKKLGKCQIKMKIYSCSICNHSFNKMSSLEEHKRLFHGRGPSPEVNDGFSVEEERSNEGYGIYCNVCHKEYATKTGFRRHLKNHEMSMKMETMSDQPVDDIKCITCSASFPNISLLEIHQKVCQQNPESLDSFVRTVIQEQVTCKYCDKEFQSQQYLKQHILSNCPVFQNCKKCLKCGKYVPESLLNRDWSCKYCTERPVKKPVSSSKPVSDKAVLYQCPVGKKRFMSRSSMMNHYASCSGNCKNTAAFFCKICRKRYSDINRYNEHKTFCQKMIASTKPIMYPCSYCPRSFSRYHNRATHEAKCLREMQQNTSNVDGSSNDASNADVSTSDVSNVEVKLSPMHICDVCNAAFKNPKLLSLHRKKYRKQCNKLGVFQSYSCNICNNSNLFQYQLYKHTCYCIKKKLKTKSQIICNTCNREFTRSILGKEFSLLVHGHILDCLKVPYHPNEKPNADSDRVYCWMCGFAFVSAESLKIHTITAHCSKSRSSRAKISQNEDDTIKEEEPSRLTDSEEPNQLIDTEEPNQLIGSEDAHQLISSNEPNKLDVSENFKLQMKNVLKASRREGPVVKVTVPGNFSCPYCYKRFSSLRSLLFHKSAKHHCNKNRKFLKNKILQCKICNRQFFSSAKLENHEKVHGIIRETVFAEFQKEERHSEEAVEHTKLESSSSAECDL